MEINAWKSINAWKQPTKIHNLCTEGVLEHTICILEEYPDLILLLNACLPPLRPLSWKLFDDNNYHNYLIQNPDGYVYKEKETGKYKQA